MVTDRDLEAGDLRQPVRQQPLLQRARHVRALLVQPRALERVGRLVGERGEERTVAGHEAAGRAVAEDERGEHAPAERDRDDDHRLERTGDRRSQLRIALPVVERLQVHGLAGPQPVADGSVDVEREPAPRGHRGVLEAAVVAHLDLVAHEEGERPGRRVEALDGLADHDLADLVGRARRRQRRGHALQPRRPVRRQLGLAARLALAREDLLALAVGGVALREVDHHGDHAQRVAVERDAAQQHRCPGAVGPDVLLLVRRHPALGVQLAGDLVVLRRPLGCRDRAPADLAALELLARAADDVQPGVVGLEHPLVVRDGDAHDVGVDEPAVPPLVVSDRFRRCDRRRLPTPVGCSRCRRARGRARRSGSAPRGAPPAEPSRPRARRPGTRT